MSIKCYWGANGSYKSASAVQYDVIPELLKGRFVITNIRGLTLEKCLEQYPDIPEKARVVNINFDEPGAMEKIRTWFRWAPVGALIVLDEIQLIYPRAWTAKTLEQFRLKKDDGSICTFEECERDGQPYDLSDAFTRHRHFNWDIVLTTPNIRFVHAEIRMTTEAAYRQANGALVGIKGRFKRSMHDAQENQPNKDSIVSTHSIKQKTFKCYQSTSTGQVQDTRAGTSILKSPKVVLLLAFAALCIGYALFNLSATSSRQSVLNQTPQAAGQTNQVNLPANSQSASLPPGKAVGSAAPGVPNQSSPGADYLASDPFSNLDASITYYASLSQDGNPLKVDFWIEFDDWDNPGRSFTMKSAELKRMGYAFNVLSDCAIYLLWKGQARFVSCWNPFRNEDEEEETNAGMFELADAGAP